MSLRLPNYGFYLFFSQTIIYFPILKYHGKITAKKFCPLPSISTMWLMHSRKSGILGPRPMLWSISKNMTYKPAPAFSHGAFKPGQVQTSPEARKLRKLAAGWIFWVLFVCILRVQNEAWMILKTILLTHTPSKSYIEHILPLQWLQLFPHKAHCVAARGSSASRCKQRGDISAICKIILCL